MGYTTDFEGRFNLDKKLTEKLQKELEDFAEQRHGGNMDVHEGYPGFWCNWTPTEDGMGIEWNGAEKFYDYVEWLQKIIDMFLEPNNYKLSGSVVWQGEDSDDVGKVVVKDNVVSTLEGVVSYQDTTNAIDNHIVWTTINEALQNLGMVHRGGGDSSDGFEDTYVKGDYQVTIGMSN